MQQHQFSIEELREAFEYLDELRESGRTNMFGAQAYVCRELLWPKDEARAVTTLWMETFSAGSMQERIEAARSGEIA